MIGPPPSSTPFPYTPLFRSGEVTLAGPVLTVGVRVERRNLEARGRAPEARRTGCLTLVRRHLRHGGGGAHEDRDRKSTRLNSSHANISYAVFCLKKKKDMKL